MDIIDKWHAAAVDQFIETHPRVTADCVKIEVCENGDVWVYYTHGKVNFGNATISLKEFQHGINK